MATFLDVSYGRLLDEERVAQRRGEEVGYEVPCPRVLVLIRLIVTQ